MREKKKIRAKERFAGRMAVKPTRTIFPCEFAIASVVFMTHPKNRRIKYYRFISLSHFRFPYIYAGEIGNAEWTVLPSADIDDISVFESKDDAETVAEKTRKLIGNAVVFQAQKIIKHNPHRVGKWMKTSESAFAGGGSAGAMATDAARAHGEARPDDELISREAQRGNGCQLTCELCGEDYTYDSTHRQLRCATGCGDRIEDDPRRICGDCYFQEPCATCVRIDVGGGSAGAMATDAARAHGEARPDDELIAREADRKLTAKNRPVPLLPPAKREDFCQAKFDLGGNCYECWKRGDFCHCEREKLPSAVYFIVAHGEWIAVSPPDSLSAAVGFIAKMSPANYRQSARIVRTQYPPKHRQFTVREATEWPHVEVISDAGGVGAAATPEARKHGQARPDAELIAREDDRKKMNRKHFDSCGFICGLDEEVSNLEREGRWDDVEGWLKIRKKMLRGRGLRKWEMDELAEILTTYDFCFCDLRAEELRKAAKGAA